MQLFIDSFILLGLSQLLTTGVYFSLHHRTRSGLLFISLFFCLACYVGFRHSILSEELRRVVYQFSLLTPMLLYAISRYLFIDEARMKKLDWVLIVYFITFRIVIGDFYAGGATSQTSAPVLVTAFIMPLAILIYFSVLAALYTIQGYKADLLENRRKLRVYFVFSTLVFVVPRLLSGIVVYSYLLVTGEFLAVSTLFGAVEVVYLALLFLAFIQLILRSHNGFTQLFSESPAGSSAPAATQRQPETQVEPAQDAYPINAIRHLMESEKLYTRQGFTISDLAVALGEQEKKIRQTINTEMGFRNFNQLLNQYRLQEASKLLRSSKTAVSTIAFDVGYSSLSSFNSVFKNQFGVTPTEFRTQAASNRP